MKTKILILTVIYSAIFTFASITYAQNKSDFKGTKSEKLPVVAIADFVGEANLGNFDVNPQEYQKYLKSEKIPSAVMVYLIKTGNEIILVDSGYGNKSSLLMDGLAKEGVKPEDITLVLLTHMHGDHIGGLLSGDKTVFPNAKIKVSRKERDFWVDDKSLEQFPSRQANFALVKKVIDLYGDAMEVFEFGNEVAPDIMPLDTSGHTPGHAAFIFSHSGKIMMFIGDIVNVGAVQFPRPDISSKYDMDPVKAAETRKKILALAAENKLSIAGAHIPVPGIGKVKSNGKAGYKFKPQ